MDGGWLAWHAKHGTYGMQAGGTWHRIVLPNTALGCQLIGATTTMLGVCAAATTAAAAEVNSGLLPGCQVVAVKRLDYVKEPGALLKVRGGRRCCGI